MPELTGLICEGNQAMMLNNHENHEKYMKSVFFHYEPNLFVETLVWVFRACRSHGFDTAYYVKIFFELKAICYNYSGFKNMFRNETKHVS